MGKPLSRFYFCCVITVKNEILILLGVVPKLVADLFSNRKNGSNINFINYYLYFSTPTPAPPPFTGEGNRNRKSISLYRKRGSGALRLLEVGCQGGREIK